MTKPALPENFTFNTATFFRYGDKEKLWAIGKEWLYKGNVYQAIVYGDWTEGTSEKWVSYDVKNSTQEFRKSQTTAMLEIQTIMDAEKEKKHASCVEKWLPQFNEVSPTNELHPYLFQKQIKNNHCAKNRNGLLMIPAYDHNGFTGLQLIYSKNDEYIKRFSTGIKKKGSFTPLTPDYKTAEYIYIAEGYATACSVYEVTGVPTISAFDCGNLYDAIRSIRFINPTCKIIICADDDKNNIGAKKAYHCKAAFHNVIIRKPKFEYKTTSLTDFNDLYCTEGEAVVKEQLTFSEADFIKITPLGTFGDKTIRHFYFSSMTNRIYQFLATEHNKNNLLQMAPKKYWGEKYGFSKDKDNVPTETPLWGEIPGKLFVEQSVIGFFNPKNIRGTGPWIDNKRFVYNMGDHLLLNGERVTNIPDSTFLYQTSPAIELAPIATIDECNEIIKVFYNLNYRNKEDFFYLCGWMAMSPIFNYIDWRPHVWITGSQGTGKSSVLKMISKIASDGTVYQSVTAAAIRQHLKHDAASMIIDEAEPNSKEANKRMDEIIEVIRQCSSNSITKSLRGSATGDAIEYNVNSCFLLGSIQTYLPTEADRSRFFQIELLPNGDHEKWKQIQHQFTSVEHLAPRLMSRMIKMAPIVRANIRLFKELLVDKKEIKTSRMADQISSALGCYYAMQYDTEIPLKDAQAHVDSMDIQSSNYVEENETDEAQTCLDALLDTIIDRQMHRTLRDAYQDNNEKILNAYGLVRRDKTLFISNSNSELRKIMEALGYSNHSNVLRRHKQCVERSTVQNINGQNFRGVKIKID